eukprot:Nk52_evm1s1483 gene=Nk52_evmTU1s1483
MKEVQATKGNNNNNNHNKNDASNQTFATEGKCAYCKGKHSTWKCDKRRKAFATELASVIRSAFPTSSTNGTTSPPSENSTGDKDSTEQKDDMAERLQFAMQRYARRKCK